MSIEILYNHTGERGLLLTALTGPGAGSSAFFRADSAGQGLPAGAKAAEGGRRPLCEPAAADPAFPKLTELPDPRFYAREKIALDGQTFFAETLLPETELVICGCGHVGCALIRLAKYLGLRVTAFDDRPSFVSDALAAGADRAECGAFARLLTMCRGTDTRKLYVVMTRGHRYDLECLREILVSPYLYLGMMGSRGRSAEVRRLLAEEGFPGDRLEEVHAPIGLRIGAETPEEIAVSVAAELIPYLRGEEGMRVSEEDLAARRAAGSYVEAVITDRIGSGPRNPGSRMLIYEDGRTYGTIGGGCMEAEVIERARRMKAQGDKSVLMKVDLTGRTDETADAMACGGLIEVFLVRVRESRSAGK